MIVRKQRGSDDAAVRAVLLEAFGEQRVADLAAALRARPDLGSSFVAEQGGEIVGHVQLSISWVDAPRKPVDVLVLSPLAVRPDSQRRGIGSALVAAAIDEAEALGVPVLFLEGDPGYYSKLGWERATERGFTPPSTRIPDAGFQCVVFAGRQDWMTGALVYNDTFWAHDCVGLRPATT